MEMNCHRNTALLSGEPIPGIAAAGTDYMEQEEIEDEE